MPLFFKTVCQDFIYFPPFRRPSRPASCFRIPVPKGRHPARDRAGCRPAFPRCGGKTKSHTKPALSSVERGSAKQAGLLASIHFRPIRLPGVGTSGGSCLRGSPHADGYSGGTARDFHPLPFILPADRRIRRGHLLGCLLKYAFILHAYACAVNSPSALNSRIHRWKRLTSHRLSLTMNMTVWNPILICRPSPKRPAGTERCVHS